MEDAMARKRSSCSRLMVWRDGVLATLEVSCARSIEVSISVTNWWRVLSVRAGGWHVGERWRLTTIFVCLCQGCVRIFRHIRMFRCSDVQMFGNSISQMSSRI